MMSRIMPADFCQEEMNGFQEIIRRIVAFCAKGSGP